MRTRYGAAALAAVMAAGCEPVNGSDGGVDAGRIVAVASMPEPRARAVAFPLPGDRVLVAGGVRAYGDAAGNFDGGVATVSEVFTLATGAWSTAAGPRTPRLHPVGVLLAPGRPAVLGGLSRELQGLSSVEGYDLDAGSWSVQGQLTVARGYFSATPLASGQVLVVGGLADIQPSTSPLATAELYDPNTGTSTPTGSLHDARALQAMAVGSGGRVLVAGGVTNGSWTATTASVEIYQPDAGTWRPASPLPAPLAFASATALASGQVLVAGGCVDGVQSCGAEQFRAHLYDLDTGARADLPAMPVGRSGHEAVLLPSGLVLLVGGDNPAQGPLPGTLFDPSGPRWLTVPSPLRFGTFSASAPLSGGRVLVVGGHVWNGTAETTTLSGEAGLYQP